MLSNHAMQCPAQPGIAAWQVAVLVLDAQALVSIRSVQVGLMAVALVRSVANILQRPLLTLWHLSCHHCTHRAVAVPRPMLATQRRVARLLTQWLLLLLHVVSLHGQRQAGWLATGSLHEKTARVIPVVCVASLTLTLQGLLARLPPAMAPMPWHPVPAVSACQASSLRAAAPTPAHACLQQQAASAMAAVCLLKATRQGL
ncbi:hypothetical protein V8C86DRAFT_836553 [Haematococcus lacustris]